MKTALRILLTGLVIVLFLSFVPSASAGTFHTGRWGELTWTLDRNDVLTISGQGIMSDFDYNSSSVWRAYKDSVRTVNIEEGVTSIGNNAFRQCTNLTSVTIPESVTSIGCSAFCFCDSLTRVNIPDSVTYIGSEAFYDCGNLMSLTIGNSVTSIGAYAFYKCRSLTSVTIPDSVTSIERYSFNGCSRLTSLTIGNSVTSICDHAFYDCSILKSVTIPDSVTEIGVGAFYNCSSVIKVYYCGTRAQWNQITGIDTCSINSNALRFHKLIHHPEEAKCDDVGYAEYWSCDICGKLFNDDVNLVEITAPVVIPAGHKLTQTTAKAATCTEAGYEAYWTCSRCNKLFSDENGTNAITVPVEIPATGHKPSASVRENEVAPTIIKTGSYDEVVYCSVCHTELSRTGKTIPALRSGTCGTNIKWTVTENSDGSFALSVGPVVQGQPAIIADIPWDDCRESIAAITLETGITGIGDNAFSACTNISSVVLPSSVQSIGNRAFNGCSNLKTLALNDGLFEIGSRIIENTALTELSIPESLSTASTDAFASFNGQLYAIIGSAGAKTIGNAGCSFRDRNLMGLVFQYAGEHLTLVCADSTLRTVDVPHGVTDIGAHAFENNTRLSSVTLPGTLKEIGDYAFYSCSRLNSIQLPYGLTRIGQYAFNSCLALNSLTVPYSVTDIGTNAFDNCSSLTLTVYEGSRAHVYATQNYVPFVLSNQGELVFGTPDFLLPAALTAIEDEAFMGNSASCIELSSKVQSIGNSAFEDCRQLKQIYIPASVTYISPTAFNGTTGLVIFGAAGSYADDYAYDYGFTFAEK